MQGLFVPYQHFAIANEQKSSTLEEECFNWFPATLSNSFPGRCVAEVRVGGVETEYVKRPYDYSVGFVLRSLLIIDALQTFGPEYRLLVSSLRDISHIKSKGNG